MARGFQTEVGVLPKNLPKSDHSKNPKRSLQKWRLKRRRAYLRLEQRHRLAQLSSRPKARKISQELDGIGAKK